MRDVSGGGLRSLFCALALCLLLAVPSDAITPGGAKLSADASAVELHNVVITASFPDGYYAQSMDGSSGIRVTSGSVLQVGGRYSLTGLMGTTVEGERYLSVVQSNFMGSQTAPKPYSVISRSLGHADFFYQSATGNGQRGITQPVGKATNMVGLLIKTAGEVVATSTNQIQINDWTLAGGSIRVDTTGLYFPAKVGDWVVVTGIASITKVNGEYYSLIRPRGPSDLQLVRPASTSLQNDTVEPASGLVIAERETIFAAQYMHPVDNTRLRECHLLINTSLSLVNGMAVYYHGPSNRLYLKNDNNTAWLGGFAPGSANTIQNSRVTVDCQKTKIENFGNYRRISWSLQIKRFAADKRYSIWMYVDDTTGGSDGWDQFGSVYVVSPPPDPPGG